MKKNKEEYIKDKVVTNDLMIDVDNVSMKFNLGIEKNFSLKQWFVDIGKHKKKINNEFYALKDVDFKVNKGEVVGFIGSNGAGKSTLLKVVAGVMKPTKGSVKTYGNICPMIELGAGFDPQLTARENIYLDGAIMGYSKELIDSKFDAIVDFAELRDFLDVPVQNFSSGMTARLAFSIATIVDPDILIVDEILSVGDMAFQAKSEEKMKSMIGGGTTVLYVSHSIEQIKKICNRVIWIEHGVLKKNGGKEVCDDYKSFMDEKI
jgi:ABC-2 type transport system ATP-binding protein